MHTSDGRPMSTRSSRPWRRPGSRLASAAGVVVAAATVLALAAPGAAAATTVGGLWHLDESSGSTAVDSSGTGNDGTLRGDVAVGLAGHTGTAFSFAEAGSWVEVPSSTSVNPGRKAFTVTAWVNFTVAPGKGVTYDIVRKGLVRTAGGEFKLEIVKGGLVRCTAKDSTGQRGAITGPKRSLADGQWHRIGCARTSSGWSVLVDNKVRTRSVALGSISNTESLAIGSKYGKEDGTPGRVDEVELSIG